MTKIYYVYCEEYGEAEGFFDEDDNLLHYWWGNDASWRGEYTDPLLKKVGVEVVYPKGKKLAALKKKLFEEIDQG